jgi:hypothetical protein
MRNPFGLPKFPISILVFLVVFGIWTSAYSTVFDNDVEILQSDQTGVTLRYAVPEPSFDPFEIGGSQFYWMNISAAGQNGKDGEVEIPVKIIPLAMPPRAKARIQILNSEYRPIDFKKLAPYFVRFSQEKFAEAYSSAQASNPTIPSDQPFIAPSGDIRGLNIARVAIPTGRYSLSPASLSVLTSMTLRIDFEGGQLNLAAGLRNPGATYNRILQQTVANYDVGKSWFISRTPHFGKLAAAMESPFDSATTWIRIEVPTEGVYSFGWLQFNSIQINPSSIDPSQIRMFYGGGKELEVPNNKPRPTLTEIPIEVMGGDDGHFDSGDLIVFYGDAVDSWGYDSLSNRFAHYRNHYTDKNVYWLTIDGSFSGSPKRIAVTDGTPNGSIDVSTDTYNALYHKEQEAVFYPGSYGDLDNYDWYWGNNNSFDIPVQLDSVVSGGRATIVTRQLDGVPFLHVNGSSDISPISYGTFCTYSTTQLVSGLNTINAHCPSDFYFDYIDIHYPRWLKVLDGTLRFSQPDTFGTIRYNMTDVRSPYYLLDISNKTNPVKIIGGSLNGTNLVFDDTVSAVSHKQYFISSQDRFKSPSAVSIYQIDNLRDASLPQNRADEIIITYDGFYDQAVRLAQHRQLAYGLTTRVVKASDIYNQFSFGLFDPLAIRDFLKYAYENWPDPAPTFALLVGDGNYDFRNNLGINERNYIPPFEKPDGNDKVMSDERFIYFGGDGYLDSDADSLPDMVIGRLPSDSPQETDDMVTKIIDYDSNPDLGSWRDRIVIAADDNLNIGLHLVTEREHTDQAEILSNRHIPSQFEIAKIYEIDYLLRANGEKPEARDALIGAFNQGALIVDWIGHGSGDLWAHEHIFRRTEDMPRLINGKKLPLIFAASCDIGMFDVPGAECMGEDFMKTPLRGSIGVISATREVFGDQNSVFNQRVFDQLLYNDSIGIGAAVYIAKLLDDHYGPTIANDKYYVLFGDPAQLLEFPKYKIRMTSAPDSIMALSVDSLSGDVTDSIGNLQSDFNGTVSVTVKDGAITRSVVCRDFNNNPVEPPLIINVLSPGANIFVGPAEVVGGHFTSRFFIPKDISYGSHGAKIFAYGDNNSIDAVGSQDSILISGSLPNIQDTTGPTINLFADTRPFSLGTTLVPPGFTLGADIQDEHGINITGQLGHGIVLSIDGGDSYEGDLTGNFQYDLGNYQRGRLDFKMPELTFGEYELTLKAWDNFNNSSVTTQRIEIVENSKLALSDVMNYPNPIKKGDSETAFQYCLNTDADMVTIKLFTEAGRKIKTIDILDHDKMVEGCHHEVSWDLLDADGDKLANGIYIYKISASRANINGNHDKADETGKLVILR